jgi:hypothetical protein
MSGGKAPLCLLAQKGQIARAASAYAQRACLLSLQRARTRNGAEHLDKCSCNDINKYYRFLNAARNLHLTI